MVLIERWAYYRVLMLIIGRQVSLFMSVSNLPPGNDKYNVL